MRLSANQCLIIIGLFLLLLYNATTLAYSDIGILSNNGSYLNTPTYDGSGQAVHPDIIYTAIPWNGYHYIFAYTPYPYSNDQYENPSLRGSNDGIHFSVFPGQPDPIIPSQGNGWHNCDPSIVLKNGTLYYFYIVGNLTPKYAHMNYTSSTNPNTWTTPIQTNLTSCVSPAVIYDNGLWKCWAVDETTRKLRYFTSTDLVDWVENCTVNCNPPSKYLLWHYQLWHPNVKKIGDHYEALISCSCTMDEHKYLLFARSQDGLNWTFPLDTPILSPGPAGEWDDNLIYRSTFLLNSSNNNTYDVWYSAEGDNSTWHIGYIEYHMPTADKQEQSSPWYSLIIYPLIAVCIVSGILGIIIVLIIRYVRK